MIPNKTTSSNQNNQSQSITSNVWRAINLILLLPTIYFSFITLGAMLTLDSHAFTAWQEHKLTCEQVPLDSTKAPMPGQMIVVRYKWRCPEGEYHEVSTSRPPTQFFTNNRNIQKSIRCNYWGNFLPVPILSRPEIAVCPPTKELHEQAHQRLLQ